MPTHEATTLFRLEYIATTIKVQSRNHNKNLFVFEEKLRADKMANKGEDSNTTTTDDNISLNEVKCACIACRVENGYLLKAN